MVSVPLIIILHGEAECVCVESQNVGPLGLHDKYENARTICFLQS